MKQTAITTLIMVVAGLLLLNILIAFTPSPSEKMNKAITSGLLKYKTYDDYTLVTPVDYVYYEKEVTIHTQDGSTNATIEGFH